MWMQSIWYQTNYFKLDLVNFIIYISHSLHGVINHLGDNLTRIMYPQPISVWLVVEMWVWVINVISSNDYQILTITNSCLHLTAISVPSNWSVSSLYPHTTLVLTTLNQGVWEYKFLSYTYLYYQYTYILRSYHSSLLIHSSAVLYVYHNQIQVNNNMFPKIRYYLPK